MKNYVDQLLVGNLDIFFCEANVQVFCSIFIWELVFLTDFIDIDLMAFLLTFYCYDVEPLSDKTK